jgi:MFS family permease
MSAKRNLFIVTLSDGLSRFGDHFQMLGLVSLTYGLTGSPLATAAQMAVGMLPGILFARWTGRLADRRSARLIVGLANGLTALLTLLYILLQSVPLILALNFVRSTVMTFARPAYARLMPELVGREGLLQANARRQTVIGVIELVGPVTAGWIVDRLGERWGFGFNALSFLVPALAMLLVRPVEKVAPTDGQPAYGGSAFAFLRGRPSLLLLVLANGAFMIGMFTINSIFYPYTIEVLHGGAKALGAMVSAYFGATLLAGLIMERWGHRLRRPGLELWAYAAGGIVWLGYPLTASIPVAVGISVLDGLVYTGTGTIFETRVQAEAPPEAIGRVYAVAKAVDQGGSVLGCLVGGLAATFWSVRGGFFVGIGLTLGLLAGLALWRSVRAEVAVGVE